MPIKQSEIPAHVVSFETELGSRYTYLPDGTTRRFRQVSEEIMAPQEAIVFVPPYELVIGQAPDYAKPFLGTSPAEYVRRMIEYAQKVGNPNFRARIMDSRGNMLWKNVDIKAEPGQLYLAFLSNKHTVDYQVPVSKEPKEGYYPFDATRRALHDHAYENMTHLGSKITIINVSS